MLLALLAQVFAVTGIGQIQTVFIDDHRLQLDPLLPGFLGDVLENLLADGAGQGREVQPLGFLAQLDAIDGSAHGVLRGCK